MQLKFDERFDLPVITMTAGNHLKINIKDDTYGSIEEVIANGDTFLSKATQSPIVPTKNKIYAVTGGTDKLGEFYIYDGATYIKFNAIFSLSWYTTQSDSPILTENMVVSDGSLCAEIDGLETLRLSGKYIYQVTTAVNSDAMSVSTRQGVCYIVRNIDIETLQNILSPQPTAEDIGVVYEELFCHPVQGATTYSAGWLEADIDNAVVSPGTGIHYIIIEGSMAGTYIWNGDSYEKYSDSTESMN